jgi:hypothetical protein
MLISEIDLQALSRMIMGNKKQLKKLHSQYTLLWCLKVGEFLGTLNTDKICAYVNIKPVVLQRWLSGKQTPPEAVLNRIKVRTFASARIHRRKHVLREYPCDVAYQAELIETKYLWKLMLFDEMNLLTKRRFCRRLKKALLFKNKKMEIEQHCVETLGE